MIFLSKYLLCVFEFKFEFFFGIFQKLESEGAAHNVCFGKVSAAAKITQPTHTEKNLMNSISRIFFHGVTKNLEKKIE